MLGSLGVFLQLLPLLTLASPAHKPAPGSSPSDVWQSWGGQAEWHFNTDLLLAMGLRIDAISGARVNRPPARGQAYHLLRFPAQTGAILTFHARGKKLYSLADGALQYSGGFILHWPAGSIDLRGYSLRPHATGAKSFMLDVLSSHGQVVFVLDHAHYSLETNATQLSLRNMNIRLSAQLARRLGRPQWAMRTVGGMDVLSRASIQGEQANTVDTACTAPWPSEAGADQVTNIKLLQRDVDSILAMRCHLPRAGTAGLGTPCTLGSMDGLVVIAPDASLVNVGDTAVPWYSKFNPSTGGVPQPPYANDQHPFLVWNLYRIDADGSIRQIGKSGVKHAFFTVNKNCGCADHHHVVFPQCVDTYSVYNNDQNDVLAPRSELIPARAIWGRCGSVYDQNCDGHRDRDSDNNLVDGAANSYDLRLLASESDLDPGRNPGARYFLEYWYLVRDDDNIFDTMGRREISPFKQVGLEGGAVWSFSPQALVLGPAMDNWLAPNTATPDELSSDQASSEGHFRVGVRVSNLGNGHWRYRYAVMNFDFARAVIDPAHASEPNLKLLSNAGFDALSIPLPSRLAMYAFRFTDADRDAGDDWIPVQADNDIDWQAPGNARARVNTLDWGTLYTFTFEAPTAPQAVNMTLHVATSEAGKPLAYSVPSLAPGPLSDAIFSDCFEPQP